MSSPALQEWQNKTDSSKNGWLFCHTEYDILAWFSGIGCMLTHWGRVMHICVSNLTIIGSDNGLSPDQRQVIIWTNADKLSIGLQETKFNEILIEIYTFSFKKMHLKMPSGKWQPSCLSLNVLRTVVMTQNSVYQISPRNKIVVTLHINGLVQDCSNSSALAMELLQSCTKPSTWFLLFMCLATSHYLKPCRSASIRFLIVIKYWLIYRAIMRS